MATTFQHRRGSTSAHNSFTGAVGEITVNTSKDVAVVHDGSTVGGFEMLREDMSNLNIGGTNSAGRVIQSDGDGTYSFTSITTGKILQVQEVKFNTLYYDNSGSNNTFRDVTGFSKAITPSSTSSKIIIHLSIGALSQYSIAIRVLRNGTAINVGTGSYLQSTFQGGTGGTHVPGVAHSMMDSPSTTSSVTYKVQAAFYSTGYGIYINRGFYLGTPETYKGSRTSNMILMEVGP